jgi:hypothetical protein
MHAKRKSPFAYDHYARKPVGPLLMALKPRQLRPHEQTTLIFHRKPSRSWSNELNYGSMRKVGNNLGGSDGSKAIRAKGTSRASTRSRKPIWDKRRLIRKRKRIPSSQAWGKSRANPAGNLARSRTRTRMRCGYGAPAARARRVRTSTIRQIRSLRGRL